MNQGQNILLNNKDFRIITENTNIDYSEDRRDKEVVDYLKSRKDNGPFNQIDELLLSYLPPELYLKVKTDMKTISK